MLRSIQEYELGRTSEDRMGSPCHWLVVGISTKEVDDFLYEYSTFMAKNHLREYHSLDHYLFFSLNGSIDQVKRCFGTIDSSAVYENFFDGVLGFEITNLMLPQNNAAAEFFFRKLDSARYVQHTNIIFFLESDLDLYGEARATSLLDSLSVNLLCVERNNEVGFYGKK